MVVSDIPARVRNTPEVSAFFRSLPFSKTLLVDLTAGRGCAEEIREGFRAHGFSADPREILALEDLIISAAGRSEALVSVTSAAGRHEIFVKATPVTVEGRKHALISARDVSAEHALEDALKTANQQLREMEFSATCTAGEAAELALRDPLTGLPNRRAFDISLDKACSRGDTALCLMDIDRFKAVNDSLGHTIGDRLLVEVAEKLCHHTRGRDFVGRLAGDEFAILLHGVASDEAAAEAVERLLATFRARIDLGEVDIQASLSAGVALIAKGIAPADAYRQADLALHSAKAKRRGALTVHANEPSSLQEHDDLVLVKALLAGHHALQEFDPISDRQGEVVALEAVPFGRDASGEPILDRLYAAARKFGLDRDFLAAVLREVCVAGKMAPSSQEIHLALPAEAFSREDLTAIVRHAVLLVDLAPYRLVLGLPQSALKEKGTAGTVSMLSELGVGTAVCHWDFSIGAIEAIAHQRTGIAKFSATGLLSDPTAPAAAHFIEAAAALAASAGVRLEAECAHAANAPALFAAGVDLVRLPAGAGQRAAPARDHAHAILTAA